MLFKSVVKKMGEKMVAILELLGPLIVIVVAAYFFGPFLVVRREERVVLERFGRFVKVLEPGLHCYWPLLYRPRRVKWTRLVSDPTKRTAYERKVFEDFRIPLTQQEHSLMPIECLTEDRVNVVVSVIFYGKIDNVEKACYECEDPYIMMSVSVKQTVPRIVAKMDSQDMTEQSLGKAIEKYIRNTLKWEELGTRFCSLRVTELTIDDESDESPRESRQQNESFKRRQSEIQTDIQLHPLKQKLRELQRLEECVEAEHQAKLEQLRKSVIVM